MDIRQVLEVFDSHVTQRAQLGPLTSCVDDTVELLGVVASGSFHECKHDDSRFTMSVPSQVEPETQ